METPEELAFLQAHQCDEAQGYYFSRPVPPTEFEALAEPGFRKLGRSSGDTLRADSAAGHDWSQR